MQERKITIEQQADYVLDLRAMWMKVARIHGYTSPQESEMLRILCREYDKLHEMLEEVAFSDAATIPDRILLNDGFYAERRLVAKDTEIYRAFKDYLDSCSREEMEADNA